MTEPKRLSSSGSQADGSSSLRTLCAHDWLITAKTAFLDCTGNYWTMSDRARLLAIGRGHLSRVC